MIKSSRAYQYAVWAADPDNHFVGVWQTDDIPLFQSNPAAYAHKHMYDNLVKKRRQAVLYEDKRENFLCKHMNILYKSLGVEGYVEITKVKQYKIVRDKEFWRGKRVYLGLDLSQTDDNTALAMTTLWEDQIYAQVWGFFPEDNMETRESSLRLYPQRRQNCR